jgi:hypothetical protein
MGSWSDGTRRVILSARQAEFAASDSAAGGSGQSEVLLLRVAANLGRSALPEYSVNTATDLHAEPRDALCRSDCDEKK